MKGINITDDVVIYNDMPRGWTSRKYQPLWHTKVYDMWVRMWRRVYTRLYWFGSLIHPSFKYLSNYVAWIESRPRFEEFCSTCDKVMWSVDKDSKFSGNRDYYPEYMTLMTGSENSKERNARNGLPGLKRMKPVIGIPLDNINKIILTISRQDVSNYEFDPSSVGKCVAKKKKYKTHKGYKWFRLSYKHNKKYRIKR